MSLILPAALARRLRASAHWTRKKLNAVGVRGVELAVAELELVEFECSDFESGITYRQRAGEPFPPIDEPLSPGRPPKY